MTRTVLDSLNTALLSALKRDLSVILLGEDILDPYGGAFKITKGCSTAFPDRVITTPISEAGLAGVACGMALRGLRPVLEIMFGDFTMLLADQVINHITKFRWMYNNTVNLPLVIRAPMGGRRGYGPTHSQTLEKHFLGVPGLTVIAPVNLDIQGRRVSPGNLLEDTILTTRDPVFFVENKLQYLLPVYSGQELPDFEIVAAEDGESIALRVKNAPPPTITLTAYGYMAELSRQAVQKLAYEEEIFCELIIPLWLAPFKLQSLMNSVSRTGKLVVIEEGGKTLGWGAEVVASVSENYSGGGLKVFRVAAMDLPVPAAPSIEKKVLPQLDDIISAVRLMEGRNE